jgi:hypothetical protein
VAVGGGGRSAATFMCAGKRRVRGTYQNVLKTRIFVDPFGSRVGSASDDVSPVDSCDRLAEQMDCATLGIGPSFWTLSK